MIIYKLYKRTYDYFPKVGLQEVFTEEIGLFASILSAETRLSELEKDTFIPKKILDETNKYYNFGPTKSYFLEKIQVHE